MLKGDSMVLAMTGYKFVCDHACRLSLILQEEGLKLNPKWTKVEPHAHTAAQTVAQVRSRLASVSSESWKCIPLCQPPCSL